MSAVKEPGFAVVMAETDKNLVRHDTIGLAMKEAERLAGKSPKRYFVLACVGVAAPLEAPVSLRNIETPV